MAKTTPTVKRLTAGRPRQRHEQQESRRQQRSRHHGRPHLDQGAKHLRDGAHQADGRPRAGVALGSPVDILGPVDQKGYEDDDEEHSVNHDGGARAEEHALLNDADGDGRHQRAGQAFHPSDSRRCQCPHQ
jgi:hypothetical protein